MKEKFTDRQLSGPIKIKMDNSKGTWIGDKAVIVNHIISISEDYMEAGDTLTLRQLYYQLVARDIIPNHDKVYKKISSIKDDVVYSGLVDWSTFEDRGRKPVTAYYEDDVTGALQRTINSYKLDRQKGQQVHIEVWTEKDAISGILRKVTLPHTVSLVINKGYNSSTAMYEAYDRFVDCINDGKQVCILYFGDHDPSGLDMVRDIRERLTYMFTNGEQLISLYDTVTNWWDKDEMTYRDLDILEDYQDVSEMFDNDEDSEKVYRRFEQGQVALYLHQHNSFTVNHIGLTMAQIEQYNPPPNPAKITDPRAKGYIEKYGNVSYEVDALSPQIMREIVLEAIRDKMNLEMYSSVLDEEKQDKEKIIKMINRLNT